MVLCHSMNDQWWEYHELVVETIKPYFVQKEFVWFFLHPQMAGHKNFGCSPKPPGETFLNYFSSGVLCCQQMFRRWRLTPDSRRKSNCKSKELWSTYPVPWCPVIRVSGWGRASPLAVTNLVVPPSSLAAKTYTNYKLITTKSRLWQKSLYRLCSRGHAAEMWKINNRKLWKVNKKYNKQKHFKMSGKAWNLNRQ